MGTIGNRIRCARESLGVTQEQLGKLCGTTKQTIFKYENDIVTNIPMDRVEMIAHYLRTSPAFLMGWSDVAQAQGITAQDLSLSDTELELIRKFRQLDDRGKAAVVNSLEHEYAALLPEDTHNVLRIAARDGSYQEVTLTDQQAAELEAYLDQLPDVPKGL